MNQVSNKIQISSRLRDGSNRYNLRTIPRINYNDTVKPMKKQTIKYIKEVVIESYKQGVNLIKNSLWGEFNKYDKPVTDKPYSFTKDYVSATAVKNHLLNDPILDWLEKYYLSLGFNDNKQGMHCTDKTVSIMQKKEQIEREYKQLSILFEMGIKFEDEVMKHIYNKFPNCIKKVVHNKSEIVYDNMDKTWSYMLEGVPFIEQGLLYNTNNRTFGVADLIVRSDWINKLITKQVLTDEEERVKGPNLKGDYHYVVIDIKWTTMQLCSDGVHIRNSDRFPAYKGQLAIYNAAIGNLQGYTPNKSFILAKAWKYSTGPKQFQGYNCFDLLGHVNFAKFDNKYIHCTKDAIKWVRTIKYNGDQWSCLHPEIPELYPNMNNRYDTPFHKVKKELATKNAELTQIWMVGVNNRSIAHKNGIFKWTDPNCSSKILGINGKCIAPIVDKLLMVNRSDSIKMLPDIVINNDYDWQNQKELDFYVDFESVNDVFYNRNIDLYNSHQIGNLIFMIGVGYEDHGKWVYKPFIANRLDIESEHNIIQQFIDFIDSRINNHMIKYKISNRKLCYPTIFHWGHAERSMINCANTRNGNKWFNWINSINWLDFCGVFRDEPIIIKNSTKFNLKDIATAMYNHGFINTCWDSKGVSNGLVAMIDAANLYRSLENKEITDIINNNTMQEITLYNEVDTKVIYEIVGYFRKINEKNI